MNGSLGAKNSKLELSVIISGNMPIQTQMMSLRRSLLCPMSANTRDDKLLSKARDEAGG
jgi:hypothetical protein